MPARTLQERQREALARITPEELIGYVNTVSSSTKKGSYYNLPAEHVAALNDAIAKMMDVLRPFPALMTLTKSITDDARIASVIQLFRAQPENEQAVRRWECSVFLQMMRDMPPTRVFDLFHYLIGIRRVQAGDKKILKRTEAPLGGRYVRGLAERWLHVNHNMLDLWSVKYRNDFRLLARHIHLSPNFFPGVNWLFGGDPGTPLQYKVEVCRKAGPGQVPNELWELPVEVARGFALSKCQLSPDEFEKEFSNRGKKTYKEKRISAKRTAKAGGKVEYDPAKERNLFDLLVYLGAQETIPGAAQHWVQLAAKRQAKELGLNLDDVAVVLDTSPSMFGNKATQRHPLFKAVAAAKVFQAATRGSFNLFYTTPQNGNPVIPKLHGSTSYAPQIHRALQVGYEQIILIGDGYENAPEGLTHEYLKVLKSRVDTDNRISIVHLNPVGASESLDGVRELSAFAPSAGLAQVKAIPAAMFTALAKVYPAKAIEAYFRELVRLQSPQTARLMPPEYMALLPAPREE